MSRRKAKRQRTPDGRLSQIRFCCQICGLDAPHVTAGDGTSALEEVACPTHGPLQLVWADVLAELERHIAHPGRFGRVRAKPRSTG